MVNRKYNVTSIIDLYKNKIIKKIIINKSRLPLEN